MWYACLAGNAGRKKIAKNRHLGTIAQPCQAIIFAINVRIDNQKKNLLNGRHPICYG